MTALLILMVLAADPHKIVPLHSNDAQVFVADVDADQRGDVLVLDGRSIFAFPTAAPDSVLTLQLPETATAFDITQEPGTGSPRLIAVCGEQVRSMAFSTDQDVDAGVVLFEQPGLVTSDGPPYPFVMAATIDGNKAIVLPTEDSIVVRAWDGTLLREYAATPERAARVAYGPQLRAWSLDQPRATRREGLEIYVTRTVDFEPALPQDAGFVIDSPPTYRGGTPGQLAGALAHAPNRWPWFELSPRTDSATRVRCATQLSPPETHVRLQAGLGVDGAANASEIGPARTYPGLLVFPDGTPPDCNGDRFSDLILWNSDRPGVSPDALVDLLLQEDWPVRLTMHLFNEKTNRYDGKPASVFRYRAPLDWFLDRERGAPLRNLLLRDFDGDGKTDCAFSPDRHTYVTWRPMATNETSMESIRLPEPIESVAFAEDLDGSGKTSFGLRTATRLHIFYAR